MKTSLLILIIFVLSADARAQIYHPLVETGNVWNVEFQSFEVNGNIIFHYDNYRYSLGNDTMIGGHLYKTLISQRTYGYVTDGYPQYDYWYNLNDSPVTVGALREDSTKKIWLYDLGFLGGAFTGHDTLLYDFNVSIGDTLHWTQGQMIVTGIDSIQLLNGEWRRRIVLNHPYEGIKYWIEGIGATEVIHQPYWIYFEVLTQLTCFEQNGLILYKDPPYGIPLYVILNCESLATNVEGIGQPSYEVHITPNIVSENFRFLFQSAISKSLTLRLTDIFGRSIYEQQLHSGETYSINCSDFPNGILIAQLFSQKHQVWSGKMCVQHN